MLLKRKQSMNNAADDATEFDTLNIYGQLSHVLL